MNTVIDSNQTIKHNKFLNAIKSANSEQVDALWSILKYKEIGIFRKIKSMSAVLNLNFNDIIKDMPTDQNGRVIDHKTRHLIHEVLITVS
jgi:hypothetical protein